MNENWQFRDRMKRLAEPVDRRGVWENVQARAGEAGGRRRTGRLRVALYACLALVLLGGAAVGAVFAAKHFGQQPSVLVIDDSAGIGAGLEPAAGGAQPGGWKPLPFTWEGGSIDTLVMDPSDPSVLYAGSDGGLFKSTDGAESWSQLLALAGGRYDLTIDPNSPSTLYVTWTGSLTFPSGIKMLNSRDGGATWNDMSEADAISAVLYGFGKGGGGMNPRVVCDAGSTSSILYVLADSGDLQSVDGGATWTEADLAEEKRLALLDTSDQRSAFAAGTLNYVGKPLEGDGPSLTRWITTAAVDPNDDSIVYAGTFEGLYKSTDGGATWKRASTGLTCAGVSGLIIDPSSPSVFYATTMGGICKSSDGGDTWEMSLAGGIGLYVREESSASGGGGAEGGWLPASLVMAPSSPSTLYALTGAGLFRSDDGGAEWEPRAGKGLLDINPQQGGYDVSLALVSIADADILFATTYNGVLRSTDGGNSWSKVLDNWSLLRADPNESATLYAPTFVEHLEDPVMTMHSTVLKSVDAGATWTTIVPEQAANIGELVFDNQDPASLFMVQWDDPGLGADSPISILRSLDGGVTWEPAGFQLPAGNIAGLLFDPGSPETVYVRTYEHSDTESGGEVCNVYRSTDGGASWQNIAGELAEAMDLQIVIDPTSNGAVYGLTSSGLYKWVPEDDR
jgi:photosystem II stability/assembly factor-like uncharacterized protein